MNVYPLFVEKAEQYYNEKTLQNVGLNYSAFSTAVNHIVSRWFAYDVTKQIPFIFNRFTSFKTPTEELLLERLTDLTWYKTLSETGPKRLREDAEKYAKVYKQSLLNLPLQPSQMQEQLLSWSKAMDFVFSESSKYVKDSAKRFNESKFIKPEDMTEYEEILEINSMRKHKKSVVKFASAEIAKINNNTNEITK